MNSLHTQKHKLNNGQVLRLTIKHDDTCTPSPRECDNLGTLLLHPNKSHWTVEKSFENDVLIDLDIDKGGNPYTHLNNLLRHQLELDPQNAIAYPVTKYEHGSISLSLGYEQCWDCCVIGFVFVEKDKVRKEFGVKRVTQSIIQRVSNRLQKELDTLADWLNGDVYGFEIERLTLDDMGDVVDTELLDSCLGYVGDESHCMADAQDTMKQYLNA